MIHSSDTYHLSGNARKVLERRYLLRKDGHMETPEELFRRVAKAVASAELRWGNESDAGKWEEIFFGMMSSMHFLPNSPTLMNAGTRLNQLSACFVLPVGDSLDQIFTSLRQAAIIQQSGGGTGFNFSHLRPAGDPLTNTQGTASGPLSFIKVFDAATEHIKHGGKRRGANMGILNIDHPDIALFIDSKNDGASLQNFNLSVGITDDFMKMVERNGDWDLLHPTTRKPSGRVKARELWEMILLSAWQTGDPGLVFLDTINAANPTPELGRIESTNPCGEVPLLPYEACNLGSINLSKMTADNGDKTIVDWELLRNTTISAIRFLDNVIEINNYLLPETEQMARGNRKIGLGVMGWAELLILLEIPYESRKAIDLAGQLMQFIMRESTIASSRIADERGVFPNWEKSIYYPHSRRRNATLTSIAPTGTISIIADTSSSIEPLFALAYHRMHVLEGESLFSLNRHFMDYLRSHDIDEQKVLARVMNDRTAKFATELTQDARTLFRTALEIPPSWHLQHQLAFQQYTDNAVSKTINLPESATVRDIHEIYYQAWKQKAKGITVYRDRSRSRQVLRG